MIICFDKCVVYLLLLIVSSLGVTQANTDSLKQLLDHSKENSKKYNLSLAIAESYYNVDFDSCYKYARKAFNIAKKDKDEQMLAKSLFMIGKVKLKTNFNDSALLIFDQVELYAIKNVDSSLLQQIYAYKGFAHRMVGDFKESNKWMKKSLGISLKIGDILSVATRLNSLGITFKKYGQYDSATFCYFEAIKYFNQIGDSTNIIMIFISLSDIYFDLKEYDLARKYARQCISLGKQFDQMMYLCSGYTRMGMINHKRQQYDMALMYYDSSMVIVKKIKMRPEEANLYQNMGAVLEEQRKWDEALSHFIKARQIFEETNQIIGEVNVMQNIGVLYERTNQYEKCQQTYDTAIIIAKAHGYLENLSGLYFNKYRAYEITNEYHKAFDYQTLYHEIQDSIFSIEKIRFIKDLELKYEKEKKDADILKLKHNALKKDAALKAWQYRLIVGLIIFFAVVLVLILMVYFQKQKAKKNKIIHDKEVMALVEKEKAAAARALVEGQEEERKRVASELHDGLGVLLSNVKMQFTNFIARSNQNNEVLHKAASVLDKASDDVRRISHNMMPGVLTKFGLNISLEELMEEVTDNGELEASANITGDDKKLTDNIQIMVYRIIQELVNNTLKHAKASHISLILDYGTDELKILYSDNGIGFTPGLTSNSLGLKSINSRVRFLDGEIINESKPGKGVSYVLNIPYAVS